MTALPLPELTQAQQERFWAAVDASAGPNACWPWTGQLSGQGYGRWWTTFDGRKVSIGAHRVAMQLVKGPTTLVADHDCHNQDLMPRPRVVKPPKPVGPRVLAQAYAEHALRERLAAPMISVDFT